MDDLKTTDGFHRKWAAYVIARGERKTFVTADNTFAFSELAAGLYRLQASLLAGNGSMELTTEAAVSEDHSTVELELRPPLRQLPFPQLGDTAPDLMARTFDGGKFHLADHRGIYVLLDFWATHCPPCVAGMPEVNGWAAGYRSRGLVVVSVCVDEIAPKAIRFLKARNHPWIHAFAGRGSGSSAREGYHCVGIPDLILIAPDGKVLARSASKDASHQVLQEHLGALDVRASAGHRG